MISNFLNKDSLSLSLDQNFFPKKYEIQLQKINFQRKRFRYNRLYFLALLHKTTCTFYKKEGLQTITNVDYVNTSWAFACASQQYRYTPYIIHINQCHIYIYIIILQRSYHSRASRCKYMYVHII